MHKRGRNDDAYHVQHIGTPHDWKPPRDRRVPVHDVPCPVCKADAGELCRAADGRPGRWTHKPRRIIAIRAGL